ncbi:MAG TPA: periplasmic heavy metal sensor [Patescibacteria group bacterium]|nr:periplasmic heavy metal sensor [Patescibacteria group bacterium]
MNGGNRWKVILIVSLAFNFAVAGSLVYGLALRGRFTGESEYQDERMPAGRRGMHLGRRMGLPQEKMVRVGRIFDDLHDETVDLRERLAVARGALIELLNAERPDQGAIMDKIDEISAIQGELEKLLMKRLLRVHEILDPGEREQLLHLLQKRMHTGFHRRTEEFGRHPGRKEGM